MDESPEVNQNNNHKINNAHDLFKTDDNGNSQDFFDIYTSDLSSVYPVRHKYGCSCLYTGDLPPYPRLIV